MHLPNAILYFYLPLKVNLEVIKTSKHFIKVDMKKIILRNYGFVIFAYRLHSILVSIGLNKKKNHVWSLSFSLHFFFFFFSF